SDLKSLIEFLVNRRVWKIKECLSMKMGRQLLLLMIVTIVMGGCGNVITEDQLIGGTWLLTNGYEDGEIGGEPVCPGYEEGMEFIDRSEERRVGKECRSRWWREHWKEKKKERRTVR